MAAAPTMRASARADAVICRIDMDKRLLLALNGRVTTKASTPRGEALGQPERAALAFIAETYRAMELVQRSAGTPEATWEAMDERLALVRRLAAEQMHESVREVRRAFYLLLDQPLPSSAPDLLAEQYAVTFKQVADWLATSPKTLSRRREGLLGRTESDLALRYGRLFEQAKQAFGTEEAAREWLTSPQPSLDGVVPVELMRTELGAQQVERTLQLIDYGEYF